jgi:hypothetical protein
VFSLGACHIAILTRARWLVSFPSDFEFFAWQYLSDCFMLNIFFTVLTALDTVVRHIAEKSPRLRRLYGAFEDDTPTERRESGANNELFIFVGWATVSMIYAANVVVAIINFRQASKRIYAVGPGDVPKYGFTIF